MVKDPPSAIKSMSFEIKSAFEFCSAHSTTSLPETTSVDPEYRRSCSNPVKIMTSTSSEVDLIFFCHVSKS